MITAGRAFPSGATPLTLMPVPRLVQQGSGAFEIRSGFSAALTGYRDARLQDGLQRTLTRWERSCGTPMARSAGGNGAQAALIIDVAGPGQPVQSIDEDESYQLSVNLQGIALSAPTVVGALRGMETLLQLSSFEKGACVLPAVNIQDSPRFRWRGLSLDVSRHFEPVAVIKRTLDGMAMVKLNVFHWHLSDDQGFRAESRLFPKLTGLGSNGEFYTQAQMREIVSYAHDRGIRVVPEFDMPGHTTSWLVGYPELGSSTPGNPPGKTAGQSQLPTVFGVFDDALDPTREQTYTFIDAFLGEMAAIFPDAYLHIGGDETNGVAWLANPKIVAFMHARGLKDAAALQGYFNQRLSPLVEKHRKRMIGWDEVLNPALPKDVVIQSWRGGESLAEGARQGHSGILSAPYYLDAMKASETMYLADPLPANTSLSPAEQKLILGGEICMWSEQIDAETIDTRIWPRTAAIAERFWSPAGTTDTTDMYRRLRATSLRLEDVGLTHISGSRRLLRNITGEQDDSALEVFASVLEPVSFGERYDGQKTDALTPLDRLVDAVVPDPPSRQQLAYTVDELAAGKLASGARASALDALERRFRSWQQAAPALTPIVRNSPRLSDAGVRVQQLHQLAAMGLDAISHLRDGKTLAAASKAEKLHAIDEAEKPSALVRFTFLPSMRRLVDLAAQGSAAQ